MQELSSPFSFFYKYVFIMLWFIGFGYGVRDVIFIEPAFDGRWMQFVSAWLGITLFMYFTTGTVKKVVLDKNKIFISNFYRAEEVALTEIESVDGSSFLSPKLVWITLKNPCGFGRKITFMPKHRSSGGFGKHPMVQELTEKLKE